MSGDLTPEELAQMRAKAGMDIEVARPDRLPSQAQREFQERSRSLSSPIDTGGEERKAHILAESMLDTMREMQGSAAGSTQILEVMKQFDAEMSPEMFNAIQKATVDGHHVDGLEVAEGLIDAEEDGTQEPVRKKARVTSADPRAEIFPSTDPMGGDKGFRDPTGRPKPGRSMPKNPEEDLRDATGRIRRNMTMKEVEAEQLSQFTADVEWAELNTNLRAQSLQRASTEYNPSRALSELRKEMNLGPTTKEEELAEMKQQDEEMGDDTPPEIKKFYEYLREYYDLHGRLPPNMQRFSEGGVDMNDHWRLVFESLRMNNNSRARAAISKASKTFYKTKGGKPGAMWEAYKPRSEAEKAERMKRAGARTAEAQRDKFKPVFEAGDDNQPIGYNRTLPLHMVAPIDVMTAAVRQETELIDDSVRKGVDSSHRLRQMVEALEKTTEPEARAQLQQKIQARTKLLEERAAKPLHERLGSAVLIDLEHEGVDVSDYEYDLSTDEDEEAAVWEYKRERLRARLAKQARDTKDMSSGVGDSDKTFVLNKAMAGVGLDSGESGYEDAELSELSDGGAAFRVPLDVRAAGDFSEFDTATDTESDPFLAEAAQAEASQRMVGNVDGHSRMMVMLSGESDIEFVRESKGVVHTRPALFRQHADMFEGQIEASFDTIPALARQRSDPYDAFAMPGLSVGRDGAEAGPQAATGPVTSTPIQVTTREVSGQVEALGGGPSTQKVVTNYNSDAPVAKRRRVGRRSRGASRSKPMSSMSSSREDTPAEFKYAEQQKSGRRERSRSRAAINAREQRLAQERQEAALLMQQQQELAARAQARAKVINQQIEEARLAAEARKGDKKKQSVDEIMQGLKQQKDQLAAQQAKLVEQMRAAQERATDIAKRQKATQMAKIALDKLPAGKRKTVGKRLKSLRAKARARGRLGKAKLKGERKNAKTLAQDTTDMRQYVEDVIANCPDGKNKGEYLKLHLDFTKWLSPTLAAKTKAKYVDKYKDQITGDVSQQHGVNHSMQQAMIKLEAKRLAKRQLGALGRKRKRGRDALGRKSRFKQRNLPGGPKAGMGAKRNVAGLKKAISESDKKLVGGLKQNREAIDQRVTDNVNTLKGANPDTMSASRNAMPEHELPNAPGISATSDVKALQQRFLIYMKEKAGKLHRTDPNCIKFQHLMCELLEEEHDIGKAIPHVIKGKDLDISRLNQIIDKHALKVSRLAEVFNSFPDNQHQHLMIRNPQVHKGEAAAVIGAPAMAWYKDKFHVGTISAFHKDNNFSINFGQMGTYGILRKDFSLLDDMEYAHLPQRGEFVVHNNKLQKVIAKNEKGMAFLTGGFEVPVSELREVYHEGKPLQSLTAETGLRRYLDQIAARQTKNGYWNPRAEPATGDVVKYAGKDEMIVDPLKKAQWGKVDVAGAYEAGKNVFTKNSKGEIHLRDLRDIERIMKVSEMPFVHNTAAAKAGAIVTGVASSSKRAATREQITMAKNMQAPMPTVITDARENAQQMRAYAKYANDNINALQARGGSRADLEIFTEIRQMAVNRLQQLEAMIIAFNEQQMKVRINERNASQSLNHHIQRDKVGQMGKGIKDVTSATLAAARRAKLQKAADSMNAQKLTEVAAKLNKHLSGAEQQRFQKAWDTHPDKHNRLLHLAEKVMNLRVPVEIDGKTVMQSRPDNPIAIMALMNTVNKLNGGVTHSEDSAQLLSGLKQVKLKGRKRKMDRLHKARKGVKKNMESHAASPRARRGAAKRHNFPSRLRTNARSAAAEFKRIGTQQKVSQATQNAPSNPQSSRSNVIKHRPDTSVTQKNLPMPDGVAPATSLEKAQVAAHVSKSLKGLDTGAQDTLIGKAQSSFGKLNVARPRGVKRRRSGVALDFGKALANTSIGGKPQPRPKYISTGGPMRIVDPHQDKIGWQEQRAKLRKVPKPSTATMRATAFATGQSASGLTAPVQKQASQAVLDQSTVSGVKGGVHRTYGIDRKKVALYKERERRLRLLEKKAREVGIQNISMDETMEAQMGVDEEDSDFETYQEKRQKMGKKDVGVHSRARTGVPSVMHAKEIESKLKAIGTIPEGMAFGKMAEAIRMARHHNLPQFVHQNGEMIPLRLDPRIQYTLPDINKFVETYLQQVASHWIYTSTGQVGVDGDHSRATHDALEAHKRFREDAFRAMDTKNMALDSEAIDFLKTKQGEEDERQFRKRYRDLSTVARERGRDLEPSEIAGRTGKSGLPLTQQEIRDNIPRMYGGGGPSAGYKWLKANNQELFKIATAIYSGVKVEDPTTLIARLQTIDDELNAGAKGTSVTLGVDAIDGALEFAQVDLRDEATVRAYMALLSDPTVRAACELEGGVHYDFTKIKTVKYAEGIRPAPKHAPKGKQAKKRRSSAGSAKGTPRASRAGSPKKVNQASRDARIRLHYLHEVGPEKWGERELIGKGGDFYRPSSSKVFQLKWRSTKDLPTAIKRRNEAFKAQFPEWAKANPSPAFNEARNGLRQFRNLQGLKKVMAAYEHGIDNVLGTHGLMSMKEGMLTLGIPKHLVSATATRKVTKNGTHAELHKYRAKVFAAARERLIKKAASKGIKTPARVSKAASPIPVHHMTDKEAGFVKLEISAPLPKPGTPVIAENKLHGRLEGILKSIDGDIVAITVPSDFHSVRYFDRSEVRARPVQDGPVAGEEMAGLDLPEAVEEKRDEAPATVLKTHQDGRSDAALVFGDVDGATVSPIKVEDATPEPNLVPPQVIGQVNVGVTSTAAVLTSDEVRPQDLGLLSGLGQNVVVSGGRVKRARSVSLKRRAIGRHRKRAMSATPAPANVNFRAPVRDRRVGPSTRGLSRGRTTIGRKRKRAMSVTPAVAMHVTPAVSPQIVPQGFNLTADMFPPNVGFFPGQADLSLGSPALVSGSPSVAAVDVQLATDTTPILSPMVIPKSGSLTPVSVVSARQRMPALNLGGGGARLAPSRSPSLRPQRPPSGRERMLARIRNEQRFDEDMAAPRSGSPSVNLGGARGRVGGPQLGPILGGDNGALPIPASAVNNDARPRRVDNPGVPMSSGGMYKAMPANFTELQIQRQLDEEGSANILFKYTHEVDAITDYNIEHVIFVRVCSGAVEVVVTEQAREWHLGVMGYFLAHVVGELLVNHPTQTDSAALRHILNIVDDTASKEVAQALKKNIDENMYPNHFLCHAKFNVKYSALAHKTASKHTIRRIVQAMRR